MNTLFLITGMSGSGKSSVLPPLRDMFHSVCDVWDIDQRIYTLREHGHPEAPQLSAWKLGDDGGQFVECFNIVYSDAAKHDKDVIICGTVFPKDVYPRTKDLFKAIRWIGLYADPNDIRMRLGARTSTIWTSEMIEFHANSHTWFKQLPQQVDHTMPLFNTSASGIQDVATLIYAHIMRERQLIAQRSTAPELAISVDAASQPDHSQDVHSARTIKS